MILGWNFLKYSRFKGIVVMWFNWKMLIGFILKFMNNFINYYLKLIIKDFFIFDFLDFIRECFMKL